MQRSEYTAVGRFARENFQGEWFSIAREKSTNHIFVRLARYEQGIRVRGNEARIAYHRDGYVDWASGEWGATHFEPFLREPTLDFPGANVTSERIYDAHGELASAAYDVRVRYPGRSRHLIVSQSGEIIEELIVARVDPGFFAPERLAELNDFAFFTPLLRGTKVYAVHPSFAAQTEVTLANLTSSTQALSAAFHVQRDEDIASPRAVDVSPTTDFTQVSGFSESPTSYAHTCKGSTGQCANQGFDALNVYHHLTGYRDLLSEYFTNLGVSPNLERLGVIINALRFDLNGDGSAIDETNNALFYPDFCGKDADGKDLPRCLAFLRPAPVTDTQCGGAAQLFDLAREAVVIVHEYQHYVTDAITHMEPGTLGKPVVGDALHEGYSDYFAASYVSQKAGANVTKIGEYAFAQCSSFIRDLATIRVYANNSDAANPNRDTDPHNSGLSWASGLWKLRTELGASTVDKLALRSLFFLSTRPSFLEAVEALVQADSSLGGSHTELIRDIFYKQVRFVGGSEDSFRDTNRAIVETGLRGCAVAHGGSVPSGLSLVFMLWLLATAGVGWIVRKR